MNKNYTVYIYRSLFSDEPLDQMETIKSIEIEENLENFSSAKIMVNYYNDPSFWLNTKHLREFRRLKLIEEDGVSQKTIFDGVIFSLIPTFEGIQINLRDYRWFLEDKRYLEVQKVYTSQSSTSILTDLIQNLNAKTQSDPHPESWTFIQDENVGGISRTFERGASFFSVFSEIALAMGKSWYIHENWVIEFKDVTGEDKTQGENFTELLFNGFEMAESNIAIPEVNFQGTIENSIIPQSGSKQNNQESIEDYIRLEGYQILEGSELQNYLTKSSSPQVIYSLDVNFAQLDTPLTIGDKVAIRIQTGIIHLDIEGEVFIISKKSEIQGNEIQIIRVEVSEVVINPDSFVNKLKDIQKEIRDLKIR